MDLGSEETFFRPQWLDVEQPEEVFNVRGVAAGKNISKCSARLRTVGTTERSSFVLKTKNCQHTVYGGSALLAKGRTLDMEVIVSGSKKRHHLRSRPSQANLNHGAAGFGGHFTMASLPAPRRYSPVLKESPASNSPRYSPVAEYVSQVDRDMTVQPYESEADREARRKVEEEKRRREEEAKGANDKFRALEVSRSRADREGSLSAESGQSSVRERRWNNISVGI